jgi:hypothetical protein
MGSVDSVPTLPTRVTLILFCPMPPRHTGAPISPDYSRSKSKLIQIMCFGIHRAHLSTAGGIGQKRINVTRVGSVGKGHVGDNFIQPISDIPTNATSYAHRDVLIWLQSYTINFLGHISQTNPPGDRTIETSLKYPCQWY